MVGFIEKVFVAAMTFFGCNVLKSKSTEMCFNE